MKTFLSVIAGLLLAMNISWADEVNPEGDDAWKSLVVTIKQLDLKKLPTANDLSSKIFIQFGDKVAQVNTSEIEVGKDFVKKLTIPKAADGKYIVYYKGPEWTYNASEQLEYTFLSGTVEAGIKNVGARLKRIDVHHMDVTRDDGTTYVTTKGSFKLKALYSNNQYETIAASSTGYGIDVPVGIKYSVVVSAETEDGTDGYQATLDFTNQ